MTRHLALFSFTICVCVICGCSPTRPRAARVPEAQPMPLEEAMALIDGRDDWTAQPPINVPRHPAEKFLSGMTIVIDPGHGGEDGGNTSTQPTGYKAGPSGVKEAHVNLRVGLLLERLLQEAGVNVIMTRHGDDTISLRERAQVANNAIRRDGQKGADLFVSIHHNAGASRKTNFSSVFYHGSVDDNEPDLDVARYLALELGRALRTQVAYSAPLFSSQLMYNSGFGVLRDCHVPAVLLESSFFSNPAEEQRLRDAGYNLREAYAIYTGLCEWAYCGRPTQTTPVVLRQGEQLELTTTLDEGLPSWWGSDRSRILRSTVQVTLDGNVLPVEFEELSRELRATLPASAAEGEHVLVIHHANLHQNHNWPQRYQISAAGDEVNVQALPARRPGRQPASRGTTRPATTRSATTGTARPATTQASP